MAGKREPAPDVVDPSELTDADWAEINKLRQIWETGGPEAWSEAIDRLESANPIRHLVVMAALFPDEVRKAIRDEIAERGMTVREMRELLIRLQNLSTKKQ